MNSHEVRGGNEWLRGESGGSALANETFDECKECLTRARKNELPHLRIPDEPEAECRSGDQDLAQGPIACNDESGLRMVEENIQNFLLLLHFERDVLLLPMHDETAF